MSFCVEYLSAYLFSAMASHSQEVIAMPSAQERSIRGPPCNRCMIKSGVPMCSVRDRLTISERNYMHAHHHAIRRICHQCLQYILDERHMRWWRFLFHGHLILDDPILVPRITEYLWGAVGLQQCRCGRCDPFWLSRGWRCWS